MLVCIIVIDNPMLSQGSDNNINEIVMKGELDGFPEEAIP
jgi:hypothetical protein